MFKAVVPVAAAILYLPLVFGHIQLMIGAAGFVVVAGMLSFWYGIVASSRHPARAAIAIGGWSAAAVIFLAVVCVFGAWATVEIADLSPDSASTSVKTLAGLGTAAVAAIIGALLDRQSGWDGGAIAKRCLQKRFTSWFPSQPAEPMQGIVAWRVVSAAFYGSRPWNRKFRRSLFEAVQAARAVGGFYGGDHWQEADPAAIKPPAQP